MELMYAIMITIVTPEKVSEHTIAFTAREDACTLLAGSASALENREFKDDITKFVYSCRPVKKSDVISALQ